MNERLPNVVQATHTRHTVPFPNSMEPTSLAMNLAQLVRDGLWDELETAWTEHVLAGAALAPALEAVSAAAARREIQRCLPLVREHADVLADSGRAADAVELVGATMLLGGSPGGVSLWIPSQAVRRATSAGWSPRDGCVWTRRSRSSRRSMGSRAHISRLPGSCRKSR